MLGWLTIKKPPGATGYAIAIIALMTAFIAWIAVGTVALAVRGDRSGMEKHQRTLET